jgi:hypothetical protein
MDTYQLLYSTEQQIVGINSWYYNGIHNNNNNLFILCVSDKHIYIKNFLSNDRIYHYIDNINQPCRGSILYDNKIIISSIKGTIYIKYTCLIK